MAVRFLADYMTSSERKKRALIVAAKYRPIVRMLQHREAKITIANALTKGVATKAHLKERADFVRRKLATDDFDALTNEANADYLESFSQVAEALDLPGVEFLPGKTYSLGAVNGLKVPFGTSVTLRRTTKQNKVKVGALMLRYAKGKELLPLRGEYQAAAIFGFLRSCGKEDGAEVDKDLCITLDAYSGKLHCAPGCAITYIKNPEAACATIADAWPNVKPPKGAVL